MWTSVSNEPSANSFAEETSGLAVLQNKSQAQDPSEGIHELQINNTPDAQTSDGTNPKKVAAEHDNSRTVVPNISKIKPIQDSNNHDWKGDEFYFNADEFDIDAYHPNLIAGKEPRNENTGYLLPNKLLNTALDTNHTWDPNTVVKICVRFPLTDEDEPKVITKTLKVEAEDGTYEFAVPPSGVRGKHLRLVGGDTNLKSNIDDKADESTSRVNSELQVEYFEEVLDWDLGDPQTPSPVTFAMDTAREFGLSLNQMWDLQASIESQIDQFVRSKLNYKPPISVHEPIGLVRSDDENYNVSQVQRTSYRAASSSRSRRSGGSSRRSNISNKSRKSSGSGPGPGAGSGSGSARRKPPPKQVMKFDHSEFFMKKVVEKLQVESSAYNKTCPESDGGNFKYERDAICHICHIRKPMVVKFGCGISAHGYCDNHCVNRLGFTAADAKTGISEEAKKMDKGGYCPICAMMCICPKCQRRLDGICHEVGVMCMETKALNPGSDTLLDPDKFKSEKCEDPASSSGPLHDVDKYVVKTLELNEILPYSVGRKPVPKVLPGARIVKVKEATVHSTESVTSAAASASDTASTRKRSRYSAFGEEEVQKLQITKAYRSGRPKSSDLPFEMMDGKITHLPDGVTQTDLDVVGKPTEIEEKDDTNIDYCLLCLKGGHVLSCSVCPRAFHPKCIRNRKMSSSTELKVDGSWNCPLCIRDSQVLESDLVDGERCMTALHPLISKFCQFEPNYFAAFMTLCKIYEIVLRLMQFDFGNIFREPVDIASVPDYSDKISNPMDLGTISRKLVNGGYIVDISKEAENETSNLPSEASSINRTELKMDTVTTKNEHKEDDGKICVSISKINQIILRVLRDIELIWHNCFTYNEEDSAVYRMGQVQRHKFLTLLKCSVVKDLDPNVASQLEKYVNALEQRRIEEDKADKAHKKDEENKDQPIVDLCKSPSKKLKVHIVSLPRSWGGKQRSIFVIDPRSLEKVQVYSNAKSAYAALQYLERLGHAWDEGEESVSRISNIATLRNVIRDSGWKRTMFGYYWCFEENYKQMLRNRNGADSMQDLQQLSSLHNSHDGNPIELFDIKLGPSLLGDELDFDLDESLIIGTPQSPKRSFATASSFKKNPPPFSPLFNEKTKSVGVADLYHELEQHIRSPIKVFQSSSNRSVGSSISSPKAGSFVTMIEDVEKTA